MILLQIMLLVAVPVMKTLTFSADPPRAEIDNGIIRAVVYTPDSESGYYRGTRFDWSGNMPELEYKGHTYFGQWFENYSPTTHDAVMGPVEEFAPLGYEQAAEGGNFVKIGIGVLKKPAEKGFQRFGYYQIEDPGKWTIEQKPDRITFTHEVNHPDYGYVYTKTIRLVPGKPVMEIIHSLNNKGRLAMKTDVFDHNFFVIDKQITGPALKVTFPFVINFDPKLTGDAIVVKDNTITFNREFKTGEARNIGDLTGYGNDEKDYDIRFENSATGAGARITANRPISRLIFWASSKTLSAEPYINVQVEPGKEFTWKLTYEFYENNP
jgi:hypothetical protein